MSYSNSIEKALTLHRSGCLQEAALAYRDIIRDDPKNIDALNFLAAILVDAEQFKEAEALARQAIAIDPNFAGPYVTLGNALHGAGRLEEAVNSFLSALQIDKNEPIAYNNLASVLNDLGRHDEAIQSCLTGLALQADLPALYNNLGNAMEAKGEIKAAEKNYEKALDLEPEFPDALYNLGTLLSNDKRWDEAIALLEKAIIINPDHSDNHYNLANTLREAGRFSDAQRYYQNALQLSSDNENIINNLAITLQMQGCLEEAKVLLRSAIQKNPENPDLHWNLALVLIENGEFEEGWNEYEWRWKSSSFSSPLPKATAPLWGGEDIRGKTLVVFCEQGFGDNIQFARYLPLVSELGAKIIVVCRPELTRLFGNIGSIENSVDWDEMPQQYDYYISLLSLPRILGTTLDTIPNRVPYLNPTENKEITNITEKFSGKKVGLAWAGSETRYLDQFRSHRGHFFNPLLDIEGASFFSLQVGKKGIDILKMSKPGHVEDLGIFFNDFADTATAISSLDLVISVDTAVAHLAGALNIPVWIILSNPAGYLWMRERNDSPWYPSAQLYRQVSPDNWDTVITQICNDLYGFVNEI